MRSKANPVPRPHVSRILGGGADASARGPSRSQAQFQGMEVRNAHFTAFIDVLTANTYVMVIMSDPTIRTLASSDVPRPRRADRRSSLQVVGSGGNRGARGGGGGGARCRIGGDADQHQRGAATL